MTSFFFFYGLRSQSEGEPPLMKRETNEILVNGIPRNCTRLPAFCSPSEISTWQHSRPLRHWQLVFDSEAGV